MSFSKKIVMVVIVMFITVIQVTARVDYLIDSNYYWSKIIPEKYFSLVMKVAEETNSDLKEIIPIIHRESNWKYFFNTNGNGTFDFGLMQINSTNMYNPEFMEQFYTVENETFNMENHYHILTIGFNYFNWLKEETGNIYDAYLCYNGGIGNWLYGTTPDVTFIYADKAYREYSSYKKVTLLNSKTSLKKLLRNYKVGTIIETSKGLVKIKDKEEKIDFNYTAKFKYGHIKIFKFKKYLFRHEEEFHNRIKKSINNKV